MLITISGTNLNFIMGTVMCQEVSLTVSESYSHIQIQPFNVSAHLQYVCFLKTNN